ncbi:MAG: sulfatase-like hydrolase/transferase [Nitrospirae bacterium]|nr:sulfatase-like hydrolase/transferase [Nitrospirota bacterium]
MTAKKSFIIILKIFFILFSVLFLKEAFYKWDGYSYYMRFTDFLPDLSLAFILWTLPEIMIAFVLWLTVNVVSKLIPKSLFRLEHITTWLIFIAFTLFIKRAFFHDISLKALAELNNFVILTVICILAACIVWLVRKHTEKILEGLNTRITPLVSLFAVLLILAVPFSLIKIFEKEPPAAKYTGSASSNEKRPNIILVTWDALTALDMQLYGYNRPTTPFISEWAKDAVVFKRAYAASDWTTPASMSLMTGQRVWMHRVWYFAYNFPVKRYANNLPEILKDNGYNIYGFVQNGFAHPDTLGIGESFLTKDRSSTFKTLSHNGLINSLSMFFVNKPIVRDFINAFPFDIENNVKNLLRVRELLQRGKSAKNSEEVIFTSVPSEIIYNHFLSYISPATEDVNESKVKKPFKEPFFVWLFTLPPHSPYLPPKPYTGMFGDAEKFTYLSRSEETLGQYRPEDQAKVDVLRKRYDEFILYSDQQFRLFLSRLAETIDMSNTIIIFSADHGESFSHGLQGHSSPELYEPVVRIPLIVKFHDNKNGRIVDTPVEQTDIAPTILELAGITVPEWMEGRSLLPLLEGKSLAPRPIFSMQLQANRSFGHPITRGTVAVWDGDFKLIYYLEDKKTQLFNLRYDPDEIQNISQQEPETTEKLRKLIFDNLSHANKKITQSRGK